MRTDTSVTILRADYRAPDHLIETLDLEFDLGPDTTLVTARMSVVQRPGASSDTLVLDGEDLELVSLHLDGAELTPGRYALRDGGLVIHGLPPRAELVVVNRVHPSANTQLSGLYVSNGNFFTQCEAEGFRRITFFPDRPDVMAVYRVTLRAPREHYPVLLSNGNLVAEGSLPDGRHWARWEDPFPKPSYLFALVAGRFVATEERIVRASGRAALLQVWVEPGNESRTAHAMESLKRSIRWDEQRYGLELDLDRFMIVASNDFNMGAMENKGLNIFNAKYVLADPALATDDDYAAIEAIVGHEYFHNWTGNRVTCRDWFQLSLKEGLTVFRDQEFSADMMGDESGRAVKRIEDVRALRARQFPEDAGPMAHPVRPDSYQQINNFYTTTIYEKGAEVVRMYQTLLGREGFRRGMDLYFQRHDGQAVTCDDFRAAMADANGRDLGQFALWYSQAGTPRLAITTRWDEAARSFELTVAQSTPATPGQPAKQPFLIPLAIGLIGPDGQDLPVALAGEADVRPGTRVLEITEAQQSFVFTGLAAAPVPSLGRGFSAPVVIDIRYTESELAFLAAHDSDPFNRWEAVQRLAMIQLMKITDAIEMRREPVVDEGFIAVFGKTLTDASLSPAFRELALTLPGESLVADARSMIEPSAIRAARQLLRTELGQRLAAEWQAAYEANEVPGAYSPDPVPAGKRALRNLALGYLAASGREEALSLALAQFRGAGNMSERGAALATIVNSPAPWKADILVQTARDWMHEPLLMNKWYQVQATAAALPGEPGVLERVRLLMRHPGFSITNPNSVYALIAAFCHGNEAEFHRADGSGYAFWAEQVLALDAINPQVAARVARALDRWRRYTPDRARLMHAALTQAAAHEPLSRDVREIVGKALDPQT